MEHVAVAGIELPPGLPPRLSLPGSRIDESIEAGSCLHPRDHHWRPPLIAARRSQIAGINRPFSQGRPIDDWPETPRARRRDSGMDLSYITERILALWFPGEVTAAEFRAGHQQTAHMLQSKHGSGYMVFNLSEPKGGMRREHSRVKECGWPPALAPPLERLCSVCKDMDTWLGGGSSRVAVLHVRGERERIGVVVAAYMHYSSICGSPEQALDRFAMKRYLDHKIGDLDLPSNKRCDSYGKRIVLFPPVPREQPPVAPVDGLATAFSFPRQSR
ncbi:unnamed protein product [Nezara viridula]|uniref:Phosphatase tensin-type domain-containing protein n=1 Tax=Nezara viridula TaxID=85310 RepID=A0A9P0H1P5_NEZVI|nr:unnamed protein product [Nezara viridula]